MDLETLRRLIAKQKWTFAKSYSKTAPHEYFLKTVNPVLFVALKNAIEQHGIDEYFYHTPVRYFYLDGFKYWGYELVMNRADETNKYPSLGPAKKKEKVADSKQRRLDDI